MRDELVLQKKKSIVRLKFFLWVFLIFIIAAVLVGLLYFILYSDFWTVKDFKVTGSKFVQKEKILSALNFKMIGDSKILALLGPENILFWEFGEKPETLSSLPILSQLTVQTDLIDKIVVVDAEEREFFGIWCLPAQAGMESDCYVFDKEGVVFGRAPQAEGTLILKTYDENSRPLVFGRSVFSGPGWVDNFFKTIQIVKEHGFILTRVNIKEFGLQEWEIKVASGPIFQFSLNFVPQSLERILDNLDDKFEFDKVTYFDFRVENRIYYK